MLRRNAVSETGNLENLDEHIYAMYVDKLDGVVDAPFFERMSNQWREDQNRCLRKIEALQAADCSYMDEGMQLLELARNPKGCSRSRDGAKNDACSTSCCGTAPERMVK